MHKKSCDVAKAQYRNGVQRDEILVRQESAGGCGGHPQLDRYAYRAVCVRRLGKPPANHR